MREELAFSPLSTPATILLFVVSLKLFPSTGLQGALRVIRFKPVLTLLVVLLAVGCSKPAADGDKQDGTKGEVTKVTFNIEGMT